MENTIKNNVINININHDYWTCECCGGIQSSTMELFFPHGDYLHGHHDGHLGYSTWEGHISTAYLWILETLGISVIFDGKYLHVPCYDGYDNLDEPIRKPLFMGPLRPLYIDKKNETVHIDGENGQKPYFYTINKEVTFSLYAGNSQHYYSEEDITEEQFDEFYLNAISSYYKIIITEKEVYNDSEEDEDDYDYDGDINDE